MANCKEDGDCRQMKDPVYISLESELTTQDYVCNGRKASVYFCTVNEHFQTLELKTSPSPTWLRSLHLPSKEAFFIIIIEQRSEPELKWDLLTTEERACCWGRLKKITLID